jgi:hypothetical protein
MLRKKLFIKEKNRTYYGLEEANLCMLLSIVVFCHRTHLFPVCTSTGKWWWIYLCCSAFWQACFAWSWPEALEKATWRRPVQQVQLQLGASTIATILMLVIHDACSHLELNVTNSYWLPIVEVLSSHMEHIKLYITRIFFPGKMVFLLGLLNSSIEQKGPAFLLPTLHRSSPHGLR